jgi:hypothetical protein
VAQPFRRIKIGGYVSFFRRVCFSGWLILAGFEGGDFGPAFEFSFSFCSTFLSLALDRNFLDALQIRIPLQTVR